MAIALEGLRKCYGDLVAVDDLRLEVNEGEILALLGPNGAGKSTTLRMLTGLTRPSAGSATVAGIDVCVDAVGVRRHLGIVPQENTLDRELTVRQNLEFHGQLHRLPTAYRRRRIEEVLDFIDLRHRQHAFPSELSGGMKRRVTLAKALLHEPPILFLDEPTTGLDPQSRRKVWDRIMQLRRKGLTVLLTTHHLDEAELLCDRIGIIDAGRLVALGTPAQLRARLPASGVLELTWDAVAIGPAAAARLEADLRRLVGEGLATELDLRGGRARLQTERKGELLRAVVTQLPDHFSGIDLRQPRLEDVYLHLTGSETRD